MPNRSDLALEHAVQGKVIYLLALMVLVQFAYPFTAYGTLALITYELLYASMIVVGILLGRDSHFHTTFLTVTGIIYLGNTALRAQPWCNLGCHHHLHCADSLPRHVALDFGTLPRCRPNHHTRCALRGCGVILADWSDFRPHLWAAGCANFQLVPRWDISRCPGTMATAHLLFVHYLDLIRLRRHFARLVVGAFTC